MTRDLYPCFRALSPAEQDIILAWADLLGPEMEEIPPLAALVEAVAVARRAEELPGSREAAFLAAAASLGLPADRADAITRKLRYWRQRAGKNLRESSRKIG